jgi:H/ACA ribonucleoprotein complex subunit 3
LKHRIRVCKNCHNYTLREICPLCKIETNDPHPPKFSLEDKYIRYRIIDAYTRENQQVENTSDG